MGPSFSGEVQAPLPSSGVAGVSPRDPAAQAIDVKAPGVRAPGLPASSLAAPLPPSNAKRERSGNEPVLSVGLFELLLHTNFSFLHIY